MNDRTPSAAHELRRRYRQDLEQRGFQPDPHQERAVAALEDLGERRLSSRDRPRRWFRRSSPVPVRGLYLWGGVGRGKTYLVDLFFATLPLERKQRSHFHRFMREVHEQLAALGERRDPLELVAERVAARARVLCFDEFFVSDIGDAMILGTLLDGLFRRGVTLVATSNVAPADLYQDGLQRQRFLPAIGLLEQHTEVLQMGGGTDYRLQVLEQAEIFHTPLDDEAEHNLADYFERIAPDRVRSGRMIEVAGRLIATRRCADGVVWFDFAELCTAPRSATDYLELARLYHTVLISGVPALSAAHDDDARRFIALVDVFYDHRVKLILSAATDVDEIYSGERLAFEFRRTASRLREMQRHEYLAQPHLP